jgi:hypothetical protein
LDWEIVLVDEKMGVIRVVGLENGLSGLKTIIS